MTFSVERLNSSFKAKKENMNHLKKIISNDENSKIQNANLMHK